MKALPKLFDPRLFCMFAALTVHSCSSLHVPVNPPAFDPVKFRESEVEGLSFRAHPILGQERYWELFDDNLPEIGIVAIWISVENARQSSVELNRMKWTLSLQGRSSKPMSVSKVLDRYYKRRGIRLYSLKSDEDARRGLKNLIFHAGRLAPDLKRDGFLFFEIDRDGESAWSQSAALIAEKVPRRDGGSVSVTLPITDAHP